MMYLCHIRMAEYSDCDSYGKTYGGEEYMALVEAENEVDAEIACEEKVGKWGLPRANITVAPVGKFIQIK